MKIEMPITQFIPDGDSPIWILKEKYNRIDYEKNHYLTAYEGFEYDKASIPSVIWPILPPFGRYEGAACIHDLLYKYNTSTTMQADYRYHNCKGYTRKEADKLFLVHMLQDGVPKWKAKAMYRAVRWFGKKAWNN